MKSPWDGSNHLLIPQQNREQLCMKPNTGFLVGILIEYNWYLNLQLDRNINSPPSAHFRFPNIVLRKDKSKK